MIDFGRVQKELQECSKDSQASGIKVSPKADNLARLVGTIPGPIGTPYEGGTFQIDITLPGTFPPFRCLAVRPCVVGGLSRLSRRLEFSVGRAPLACVV